MAHGGAQAGDKLSDTVARRVLGSLYYSLESVETVIGSVNCVSVYTCWGSRRKRSSHGWVVYIQSPLFSNNMVIQIIYCISLFTFANFCQSLSIKSILQLLKTYSLTHMHYVFLKQIEKLFKIYTTLLMLKFHLDQAQSDWFNYKWIIYIVWLDINYCGMYKVTVCDMAHLSKMAHNLRYRSCL